MKLYRLLAISFVGLSLTSIPAFACDPPNKGGGLFGSRTHTDRDEENRREHEKNREEHERNSHQQANGNTCNHHGGGSSTGSGGGGSTTTPPPVYK